MSPFFNSLFALAANLVGVNGSEPLSNLQYSLTVTEETLEVFKWRAQLPAKTIIM